MGNSLEKLFDHLDNFIEYERTKERRRLTDEDFTPAHIINDIFLEEYPNEVWANKEIGFIEGDGGWLGVVSGDRVVRVVRHRRYSMIYTENKTFVVGGWA